MPGIPDGLQPIGTVLAAGPGDTLAMYTSTCEQSGTDCVVIAGLVIKYVAGTWTTKSVDGVGANAKLAINAAGQAMVATTPFGACTGTSSSCWALNLYRF